MSEKRNREPRHSKKKSGMFVPVESSIPTKKNLYTRTSAAAPSPSFDDSIPEVKFNFNIEMSRSPDREFSLGSGVTGTSPGYAAATRLNRHYTSPTALTTSLSNSQNSSAGKGLDKGLKTTAINGVYKVLQDRNSSNHIALQKYGLRALPTKKSRSTHDSYEMDTSEPIIDLCVVNSDRDEVPKGYSLLEPLVLGSARCKYQLAILRQSFENESQDLDDPRILEMNPIVDIQVRNVNTNDTLPFGYEEITTTVSGDLIQFPGGNRSMPMKILISRIGQTAIQDVIILKSNRAGPVAPPGYVVYKNTINGSEANLNAGSEVDDAWICYLKDLRGYLVCEKCPERQNDLRYITPLLLGVHTGNIGIAIKSLTYLDILISGGFLVDDQSSIYVDSVAAALSDALCMCYDEGFQTSVGQCLKTLLGENLESMGFISIYYMTINAFRIVDKSSRQELLEKIIETSVGQYFIMHEHEVKHDEMTPNEIVSGILDGIVDNIFVAKDAVTLIESYFSALDGSKYSLELVKSLLDHLFPQSSTDKIVGTVLLVLAKMASKNSFDRPHLNAQQQSLKMLLVLLQRISSDQSLDEGMGYAIRLLMMPQLASHLLVGSDPVFSLAIDIFKLLWVRFYKFMSWDLGIILCNVVLNPIVDPDTSIERINVLLEVINELLCSSKRFINIYYNYDNIRAYPLFCSVIEILGEFIESIPRLKVSEKVQRQLYRNTAELFDRFLGFMHDFYIQTSVASAVPQTPKNDKSKIQDEIVRARSRERRRSKSNVSRSSVIDRHYEQTRLKSVMKDGMILLHEKGKSMFKVVDFLIKQGFIDHNARSVSAWLWDNREAIGYGNVGDYLGGSGSSAENPFQHRVRLNYLDNLRIPSSLSLDEAIRYLLTEGGFRLPPESQKIERILEDFSIVYFEALENSTFVTPDAVEVLSNAILMLQTSLHNPNLKEKDRISINTFKSICNGIDGTGITMDDVQGIYERIKKEKIQLSFDMEASLPQEVKKVKRAKPTEALLRITLESINSGFHQRPSWFVATSGAAVFNMFELSWHSIMSTLSCFLRTGDIRVVPTCINSVSIALQLSVQLAMDAPRHALGEVLAEFTFARLNESNPNHGCSVSSLQDWYLQFNSYPIDHAYDLIEYIQDALSTIKADFIRETNFKQLAQLQRTLVSNIEILHAERSYLGQGELVRIVKGKRLLTQMFLFSDSIMFGVLTSKGRFKISRVMQLAYCTVIPSSDGNQLTVASPQGTVELEAADEDSMVDLVLEIESAINETRESRTDMIAVAERLCDQELVTESFLGLLKSTSAFVGKSKEMLLSGCLTTYSNRCKLCFKKFALFKRVHRCGHCCDPVCHDCGRKKSLLPGSTKRKTVCVLCQGMLDNGYNLSEKHVIRSWKST